MHKFKDTVVKPTCRDRGYTLHQCACGYEHKDSFIPVGEHSFEQVDEIEPTCFEEGRQDFLCSVCAEYKSEPIPKIPHKYGKWEIVNAATCTMDGTRERHCKYCAASQQEIIPALGHKWSEWTTQSFATCTEDGKSVRQCDRCKEVEQEVLPAIGHDFSEWVPSQSQEDMYERYCKNCGEQEFKSREALLAEAKRCQRLAELEDQFQMLQKKLDDDTKQRKSSPEFELMLSIISFAIPIGTIWFGIKDELFSDFFLFLDFGMFLMGFFLLAMLAFCVFLGVGGFLR